MAPSEFGLHPVCRQHTVCRLKNMHVTEYSKIFWIHYNEFKLSRLTVCVSDMGPFLCLSEGVNVTDSNLASGRLWCGVKFHRVDRIRIHHSEHVAG